MKEFHKIINDICNKHNINCSMLSDDWVIMLEKDNKTRYFVGYKADLNRSAVSNLFDDKYGLFAVLKKKNIPVCDHIILFKNYDHKIVEDYYLANNYKLVVKDNMGSCGTGVFKSSSLEDIYQLIDNILESSFSVCISPFYDIKAEYRLINIKGEAKVIYGKRKPIVIGDGKRMIIELLREFNEPYFMKKEDEKLNKVLLKDEVFEYNWQFNLSRGSIPFEVEDEVLLLRLKELSRRVIEVTNIDFCSVDIIELVTGELLVLESNSGVMMENYIRYMDNGWDDAYKVYEEAILEMFK